MAGPSWLADSLAVVMIATALYCASRLVAARRWQRPTDYDVDGVHAFMGVAMAGMLVPRLSPLWDSGPVRGAGEAASGLAVAWFGWRAIRARGRRPGRHRAAHHVQHLLASGAMLYMFAAVSPAAAAGARPGPAMTGSPGAAAGLPTLALALALFGYVIWTTDRLTSLAPVAVRATSATAGLAADGPAQARPTQARLTQLRPAQLRPAQLKPAQLRPAQLKPALSARLSACCEIAMGVTMGYMLITML